MDYLKLFSSLPNFNLNKQIVLNDGYNPTLYKWDGYWTISWISDEGDSMLDIVGDSPEEAIKNAIEYIKEHYQVSIEEISEPLFTLTAEEVEMAKPIIEYGLTLLRCDYTYRVYHTDDWNKDMDFLNNLLTRIKQWQNETAINEGTKPTSN